MKKAFTLIEVIIVLGIIAVITSIAIPNFTAIRDNSKKKADVQSCEVIKRTVMMLMADDTVTIGGKTITFNPNSESSKVSGVENESERKALEEALEDVKAPQSDKNAKYVISLVDKKVEVNLSNKDNVGTR